MNLVETKLRKIILFYLIFTSACFRLLWTLTSDVPAGNNSKKLVNYFRLTQLRNASRRLMKSMLKRKSKPQTFLTEFHRCSNDWNLLNFDGWKKASVWRHLCKANSASYKNNLNNSSWLKIFSIFSSTPLSTLQRDRNAHKKVPDVSSLLQKPACEKETETV